MTLLLALDIHDGAEELLGSAVTWAQTLGAKLDVAYVDEYDHYTYAMGEVALQPVLDKQWVKVREDNQARLEALVATIPGAHRGKPLMLFGRAYVEIAAITEAEGHDAVIVGTHGRQGLQHLLLGSVAERVVRQAPCPVIVIRMSSAA